MKRIALYVLIGSVVVSALLGIWALLVGEFGRLEGKVLITSLCISGASILAMICGVAWERCPVRLLPPTGLALAVLGFALLIVLVWVEADSEHAWKASGSILLLATAAAHGALLSLARLRRPHRWLFPAAYGSSALLAILVLVAMWGEIEDERIWRWTGVFSILLCAFTILVPVFQRMDRAAAARDESRVIADRVRFCPRCGAAMDAAFGDVICASCGGRFRVEVSSE